MAIILVHLGVTLVDRFHPKAKDLRGLTYEGRRHQADAGNDILLEEMSLMHHAGHSGKDTEYMQHNFTSPLVLKVLKICFLAVPRLLGCTAAAMLPKQARGTFRKHVMKPCTACFEVYKRCP